MCKVPKCTQDEMEHAVESSKEAFKSWSKTSVMRRQQIMFRYQEIIKANMVNSFFKHLVYFCALSIVLLEFRQNYRKT